MCRDHARSLGCVEMWVKLSIGALVAPDIPRPVPQDPIMLRWIRGDVTNYEYLLAVNFAVGRCVLGMFVRVLLRCESWRVFYFAVCTVALAS